ncbi:hypothetical protein P152DRAFT_436494 [Eremomyces bilateralis CBS 781.70]|uniref:MARVEL domain-containing protein n=1 Tax=Eremomyces bilateralis CBS 781.70 TaxID=1392243 RepID=A0A6G1G2J4_9PEZI|nr:uncharacterized protein P152DRAFT_436494 [Eremomyces bilateralis CBS 781.70]KAF1812325.1 hypothetical protein P152DRAFT_436494 [Eremomyces bilateralis CBS 781.70]
MNLVQTILRGLQFLWTILIMSLIGNMLAHKGNHSVVNYDMFVAAFAMLSLLYLIPSAIKENLTVHPALNIVLDVLNTIFFFCGGVATASYLRVHSCSDRHYLDHNSVSVGSEKVCREGQASTAFLWFGFACWAASIFFSFMSGRGSANLRGPSSRRGGPSMSQV